MGHRRHVVPAHAWAGLTMDYDNYPGDGNPGAVFVWGCAAFIVWVVAIATAIIVTR